MSSSSSTSSSTTMILSVVVGLVLVAAAAIAVLGGGGDDGFDLDAITAPSVDGDPVAAPGVAAPVVTGESLLGEGEVTIPVAGEPTLVVFLAHWCPACNAELPELTQWIEDGGLPDDVALRAVATSIDPVRNNYPPTQWFERNEFDVPTVVDKDGVAANAYGLNAFPFWAVVDADGTVVTSTSGQLGAEGFDELVELARG